MRRAGWIAIYWFAGVTFWIPTVALGLIEGRDYGTNPVDVILVTIVPVFISHITLKGLYSKRRSTSRLGSIALWMLLGIWMLGPFCMMAAVSSAEAGFALPRTAQWLVQNIWKFPAITLVMSTYMLTLFALVIITIWLTVIAAQSLTRRKDGWIEKEQSRST